MHRVSFVESYEYLFDFLTQILWNVSNADWFRSGAFELKNASIDLAGLFHLESF